MIFPPDRSQQVQGKGQRRAGPSGQTRVISSCTARVSSLPPPPRVSGVRSQTSDQLTAGSGAGVGVWRFVCCFSPRSPTGRPRSSPVASRRLLKPQDGPVGAPGGGATARTAHSPRPAGSPPGPHRPPLLNAPGALKETHSAPWTQAGSRQPCFPHQPLLSYFFHQTLFWGVRSAGGKGWGTGRGPVPVPCPRPGGAGTLQSCTWPVVSKADLQHTSC